MDLDVGRTAPGDRGAVPRLRLIFWASLALVSSVIYGPDFVLSLKPVPHGGRGLFAGMVLGEELARGNPDLYGPRSVGRALHGDPRSKCAGPVQEECASSNVGPLHPALRLDVVPEGNAGVEPSLARGVAAQSVADRTRAARRH